MAALLGDMEIVEHPSPNYNARRHGGPPELVVLHYTAMATCRDALERLCTPEFEVSAHYLIDTDGTVIRLVDEGARAWHAGVGEWAGRADVNSRSVGIELANTGAAPYAEPQMAALERLLAGVMERWNIPPEGVIGHSDMAPDRKADPGPRFDWRRLARRGLSVWAEAGTGAADPPAFAGAAARFGYPGGPATLDAFRQRFRPWARGRPLEAADAAVAVELATRWPAKPG